MPSLEAFVLIGGRSSRMGSDKALLKIDGETFAQRAVNTIRTAFPNIKISLVAHGESQFSPNDLPKDIPLVYDLHKDRGAYSGLHAALANAKSEWIFVLACDMPFVTVDLLKFMAELINGTFDAIVNVSNDGRVEPLCGFYKVAHCLSMIEQIIVSDAKLPPLQRVLDKTNARLIVFDEITYLPGAEKFLLNLNSPNDLHTA